MATRPRSKASPGQGSLFEEDYLLRTLGTLVYKPDIALTELVANAWDAGASTVSVVIPPRTGEYLGVADDGAGMTPELFRRRWMTLGYDRIRHQGVDAEFPPSRKDWKRRAYGHNGVGRHGLLCFGPRYTVDTWRDGVGASFVIGTTFGKQPFCIESEKPLKRRGSGTRLSVLVQQHLPYPDRIRDILAARFLHDPRFRVTVNGKGVPLWEHSGLLEERKLVLAPGVSANAFLVDAMASGRTTQYQGVAFWVGGRLVGEPSWVVGKEAILDGRTRLAKRFTAIVSSEDLYDEVLPDWTGFRDSELTDRLFAATRAYVMDEIARLSTERRDETRTAVVREHAAQIQALQPLARLEVADFIEAFTSAQPQATPEVMSAAVQAVINLEKSRRGRSLLEKLGMLSEEDIEGLDRVLSEWTVRDALSVLDEIDSRLLVLRAIDKLASDPSTDELHTLHPLVTQARWLFGPEFDSPEYTANTTLSTAVIKLLGKKVVSGAFDNERKRPDLIVMSDGSLSATATESIDTDTGLSALSDILIIELKKGASSIGRDEVNQGTGYVTDLLHSGYLDGSPTIRTFVVGHRVGDRVERTYKIGDPERGWVRVATFGQLVRTGERRLFGLKERLSARYGGLEGNELLERLSVLQSELDLDA